MGWSATGVALVFWSAVLLGELHNSVWGKIALSSLFVSTWDVGCQKGDMRGWVPRQKWHCPLSRECRGSFTSWATSISFAEYLLFLHFYQPFWLTNMWVQQKCNCCLALNWGQRQHVYLKGTVFASWVIQCLVGWQYGHNGSEPKREGIGLWTCTSRS